MCLFSRRRSALPLSVSRLPTRCTRNQQDHRSADVHRLQRATHKGWARYLESSGILTWLATRTSSSLMAALPPSFDSAPDQQRKNLVNFILLLWFFDSVKTKPKHGSSALSLAVQRATRSQSGSSLSKIISLEGFLKNLDRDNTRYNVAWTLASPVF